MKITLLFLWAISCVGLFLVADYVIGSFHILRDVSPGFEAMVILPGFCFWSGLLITLIAEVLTVAMVKKEKKKIWSSGPFIWNSSLLACYAVLVMFAASHELK